MSPLRIDVVGGECTGKTSLSLALVARLPGEYVAERVRVFVERHGRVPQRHEQPGLIDEAVEAINEAGRRADSARMGWVVTDAGPLMTAVYSRLYYSDDTLDVPALAATAETGLIVWCAPDIPWIADPGQRDGPQYRMSADRLIGDIVSRTDRPTIRVEGPLEQRVEAVLAVLAG